VFDFLSFDGYDWHVVDATHVQEPPVWQYLSAAGMTSVVVNVPVTHPPEDFDGALVPGYTAPERPACQPDGLYDDLVDAVGEYRVYPADSGRSADDDYAAYREVVTMRGDACDYLFDRFDPELGMVQFQQTDTVVHDHDGDFDAIRAVYGAVDSQLARLCDRYDPTTVLVVSDHGIGEHGDAEFRINEFLREEGYVTTKRGGEGMPTWSTILDDRLSDGETGDATPGSLERAMALAAQVGVTTQRVQTVLDTLHLTPVVSRFVSPSVAHAGAEQVDFPNSRAYMRSRSELGVRINLAGREPNGQVPPEEYESVRTELIDLLAAVETPDGDPVFEDVAPRDAYFDGPMAEHTVDVVTVPADFEQFVTARLSNGTFGPPASAVSHDRAGVVAAAGPAIDATASLTDAHLFDVAPTILALFDLPRAERMDGTALPLVADAGVAAYEDVQRAGDREATTDPAVEQRLRDVGYIE
jgi:predicted AlkP superfamily phosphohydrolase/phosphomutase